VQGGEKPALILVVFALVYSKMTLMKRQDALCLVASGFSELMKSVVCGAIPSALKKLQEDFYAPCVKIYFPEFQLFFYIYCCIFLIKFSCRRCTYTS